MLFKAPVFLHTSSPSVMPTVDELSTGFCGIHRGSLDDVREHTPHLLKILEDAPVDLDEYEIDIKVHMLMKGQFPCIPNWRCDNVPRIDTGELAYDQVIPNQRPMLLWVSGSPTTEFLSNDLELPDIETHGELASFLQVYTTNYKGVFKPTSNIPERTWVTMDQMTPHRGTAATKPCWRVFVRLTPKEIVTARPVLSNIRRHCQVYLPHDFHW